MPGRLKFTPWLFLGLFSVGSLACDNIKPVDRGRPGANLADAGSSVSGGGAAAPSGGSTTDAAGSSPPGRTPSPSVGPMPPAPSTPASVPMGLIGRWKLDEASGDRAADSAGNNAGALNGPTWMPQGFPGAKYPNSGSLVFDGVDDFVELGIANLPANNQPQSVTFWFNITTVPLDPQLCVSLTDGIEGGSRLKLGFRAGQVAAWKRNNGELVTGPSVTSGWHHYGYTFDGTRHTLYIDGIQAGTSTVPADTGAVAKARLGAGHSNAENFTGQLDEVRLYGHALTAAEIAALHEGIE